MKARRRGCVFVSIELTNSDSTSVFGCKLVNDRCDDLARSTFNAVEINKNREV